MKEHIIAFTDPGNPNVNIGTSNVLLRVNTPEDVTPDELHRQIEDVINILNLTDVEPELETVMNRLAEVQTYSWSYVDPEFTVEP